MTDLKVSTSDPASITSDCILLLVSTDSVLTPSGKKLDHDMQGALSKTLQKEQFQVKSRNLLLYYTGRKQPVRILFSAATPLQPRLNQLREAAYAGVRLAQARGFGSVGIAFDPKNEEEVQAIAEGGLLATYHYEPFKSEKTIKRLLESITLFSKNKNDRPLKKARVFAEASAFVRDLVNEPANLLSPQKIERISRKTAKECGLQIRVFQRAELEKMGANAFLSVGKGSVVAGRMIHLSYKPKGKARAHVAIVGKGITFDSGGLSLKNEQQMQYMKLDMAGAATALACVRGASELQVPVQVTAILMVTENMPDGGANRPGDVVRAMNGKTIEITNTDAEGRLALADGLTYAQTLNPDYLIDVATLTGAQIIALGKLIGAAMGNNRDLTEKIIAAGENSGETFWPLPLPENYRDLIKSDTADIKNSSGFPEAGSIQGGLFLSEFVAHPGWVHLDIAGPSWQERDWSTYTRNASGFGPRCLLTFLSNI